jgi:hypothetical protein
MAQSPDGKRPTRTSSVLLVALGAVAGVALGMLLANRLGGVDGVLRRGGRGRRRTPGPEGWRDDEPPTEASDELSDDDAELSGESIAYMHVVRRGEDRDSRLDTSSRAGLAMTPRGPAVPTHEELESRVLEAFQNDPILEARAIDIGAVGSGTIELTGWVTSTGEIAHALTLARGVPGVTTVVDHLAVHGAGATHSHRTAQYATPPRPEPLGLAAQWGRPT